MRVVGQLIKRLIALFWVSLCLILVAAPVQARLLVASTQPLYLIAQAVTHGIEQPHLLIPANQDGHHLQIKPQDRQMLQQSDFVLWIGAEYEAALDQALAGAPNAVALSRLNGIQRLPLRDLNAQPRANTLDPHLWLAPYNAIFTAHLIADIRSQQYPKDALKYQANARIFSQKLLQTSAKRPAKTQPYWAYHDAYQYLEKSAGLRLTAALTSDPELPPTAQQLQHLRHNRPSRSPCIFTEAHAPQALIQKLKPVQQVMIDETMREAKDFVSGWQQLRDQMRHCVDAQA